MDVWSFFVTFAAILEANGYREQDITRENQIIPAVEKAAKDLRLQKMRPMALLDLDLRASAADMLVSLFDGVGRTTTGPVVMRPRPPFQAPEAPTVTYGALPLPPKLSGEYVRAKRRSSRVRKRKSQRPSRVSRR